MEGAAVATGTWVIPKAWACHEGQDGASLRGTSSLAHLVDVAINSPPVTPLPAPCTLLQTTPWSEGKDVNPRALK